MCCPACWRSRCSIATACSSTPAARPNITGCRSYLARPSSWHLRSGPSGAGMAAASSSRQNPPSRHDEQDSLAADHTRNAPGDGTDIARAGPDQCALLQLLAGMRDPSNRAGDGEDGQFAARRQSEAVDQHGQHIIDIDELARRFRDPLRNLLGEFSRCPGTRQSFEQRDRARVAVLIDAMTEAGKALPEDRKSVV